MPRNRRRAFTHRRRVNSTRKIEIVAAAIAGAVAETLEERVLLSDTITAMQQSSLGLWLFDETIYKNQLALDASPNHYDLRYSTGATQRNGVYGKAIGFTIGGTDATTLMVDNYTHVQPYEPNQSSDLTQRARMIPQNIINALTTNNWTWEFRFTLDLESSTANNTLVDMRSTTQTLFSAGVGPHGSTMFLQSDGSGTHLSYAIPAGVSTGTWHDAAFVRTGGGAVRLYLDGTLMSAGTAIAADNTHPSLFQFDIGQRYAGATQSQGALDEMRVMGSAMYSGSSYTLPGSFSNNYGVGAQPAAVPTAPPLLFPNNTAATVTALGSEKYVFIDGALTASATNVSIGVNPPTMTVLNNLASVNGTLDDPGTIADGYGSVIDGPDGKINLFISNHGEWYSEADPAGGTGQGASVPALIHLVTTDNSSFTYQPYIDDATNSGTFPVSGTVFEDDNPLTPASQRYKIMSWDTGRGVNLWTSPDLLTWTRNEVNSLPFDTGGGSTVIWDDQQGEYLGYFRDEGGIFGMPNSNTTRADAFDSTTNILQPWPFAPASSPFVHSGYLTEPTITTELPRDDVDDDNGSPYRMYVTKYSGANDVYYAMVPRLNTTTDTRQTELAVSHDGVNWTYYGPAASTGSQPWFFGNGWSLNGQTVLESVVLDGMVERNNQIWQYAAAKVTSHTNNSTSNRLVVLKSRIDGFTSYNAGSTQGTLITKELTFSGNALQLNIGATGGAVKVALLDANGNAIPGFALSDSDTINTDSLTQTVTWHGSGDMSSLAGTTIKIEFQMQNAKLYAFQFVNVGTPQLAINNVSMNEGNSGTTAFNFTVTRTGDLSNTASVQYSTSDGTATAGSDYIAVPTTTLSFAANQSTATITVLVNGDTTVEPDETFNVNLFNASGATISDALGVGTIINDDSASALSINDVSMNEGNSGTTAFNFTVTRNGDLSIPASVQYATADGTATAGSDYTALSTSTLSFAVNQSFATITVLVNGDTTFEANETFFVNLSSASGAAISTAQGIGTIDNDDTATGTSPITAITYVSSGLPYSLSTAYLGANFEEDRTDKQITALSSNFNGMQLIETADADDYTTANPHLTFTLNQTSTVYVMWRADAPRTASWMTNWTLIPGLTITTNTDGTFNTYAMTFPAGSVSLGGAERATSGSNGDYFVLAAPVPTLSIGNVSMNEGNSGTTAFSFTVTRTGDLSNATTVQYATADGTTTAGSDYVAVPTTSLSFASNQATATVTVAVNGDTIPEPNETFFVDLSNPSGATITNPQGVGTIVNDDSAATALNLTGTNYLKLDSGVSGQLDVWPNTIGSGGGFSTYQLSQVSSIAVAGTSGSDTLTVDFSNGNPLAAITPGVNFNTTGTGGGTDALVIVGDNHGDTYSASSGQIAFSGVPITLANVTTESIQAGIGPDAISVTGTTPVGYTAPPGGAHPTAVLSSLSIGTGSKVIFNSPNSSRALLELNTANNWAGQLDLTSNDLLVKGGASAFTTVNGLVTSGFNLGTWTGQGITSSSAATNSGRLTALSVVLNTAGLAFDGAPVVTTDVHVKYTYYGDADQNGLVNGNDYTQIDTGLGSHGTQTGWVNGDFNYDGHIDGSDYSLIDNTFNMQGNAFPTAEIAGAAKALNVEVSRQVTSAPASSALQKSTNPFSDNSLQLSEIDLLDGIDQRIGSKHKHWVKNRIVFQ